jgi:competence ComEA-like helix-hairpin-helix protein
MNKIKYIIHFNKIERTGFYVVFFLLSLSICAKVYLPKISSDDKQFSQNNEITEFEKQINNLKQNTNAETNSKTKNKHIYKQNNISTHQTSQLPYSKQKHSSSKKNLTQYNKEIKKININTADTNEWKKLYGIGKVLSNRIVSFREKLGGFYSVEQIKEVYGLKPETYEQIKPSLYVDKNFTIRKIDLNNFDVKKIAAHPYIDWDLANLLIAYRKQHNGFKTIYEITRSGLVNDKLYRKLVPYLTVKKYVINEN